MSEISVKEKVVQIDHDAGDLVGKPIPRLEDRRLLTGHGLFVDDRETGRPLYLAIRRSEQAHARVVTVDTGVARNIAGVYSVFVWEDIANQIKPAVAQSRMSGYQATAIYPLANEYVRYVGEPIVAVLANSRYVAEDASDAIEIGYEVLPAAMDPEDAMLEDAPLLHSGLLSNVLVERAFVRGEVDKVFDEAPLTVASRFRFHRKTPGAMEPRAYIAEYDVGQGALTVYTSSQVPGIERDALAALMGISGNRVTVIAGDVGGGFGGKTSIYQEELLVCALAKKTGRTIKWTGDRLEDMQATSQAFDEIIDAELALGENGEFLALRADVVGDVGAYSIYPWTAGIEPVQVISFLPGPYRIPCYRGHVRAVTTPKSPTGPYRGVGRPTSTFVMERLVDMAARQLHIDPVEIRNRNMVKPSEFPYRTAVGIVWDKSEFIGGLVAAKEAFSYDDARDEQQRARAKGQLVGIGVASYAELTGIGSKISASPGMPLNTGIGTCVLQLDSTGSIKASFGCTPTGQGHETALTQVLVDELGALPEDVRIITGNSAEVPFSVGTFASKTAVISGGAAMLAARELKSRILRVAAYLLNCDQASLTIKNGVIVTSVDTEKRISLKAFAEHLFAKPKSVPFGIREEMTVTKTYDPIVGTTSSSTHMVRVTVDPVTFKVHIDKYVVAEDCGKLINPLIVDGQTRGAIAQGIGAALLEEVIYDETGQLLTVSLADYLMPSATEIPSIEIVHLDTESPNTLGGFRGMGEGGTIGAPAVIANAVTDALMPYQVEVTELPISPERIFQLTRQERG